MKTTKMARSSRSPENSRVRCEDSRGVALITTLLLLTVMIAMTLGMVIAVTSDTLITRYYQTYRSSFYAGDSGVNIVRQYMLNQLAANATVNVGTVFDPTGPPPLNSNDATTTKTNALNLYSSTASASNRKINTGNGANSWPGNFYIVDTLAGTPGTTLLAPGCAPVFTNPTDGVLSPAQPGPYNCIKGSPSYPSCAGGLCSTFVITDFHYTFPYTITALGQSSGSGQQLVEDSGQLVLDIHVAPAGGQKQNFAGWGMFIDKYTECDGSTLVPGTISGPVFTNGAWNFGTSGSYIFTDKIGSVSPTFGYQFNGKCDKSSALSDKSGNQTIAPTFQSGVNLGANAVTLPTDSFNQKEAVVDGQGTGCAGSSGCPTNPTLNGALRDINGTPYPVTGAASGVYLGYIQTTSGGVTTNTMTGGGILVEGNAVVTLTSSTSGTDPVQVYTITNNGTTTTVTVDKSANNTTVKSGASTTIITGVPSVQGGGEATMVYVDGNISSLSGPAAGPAVQDGYASTVTAAGNITITGNILYKTEPVTMTQNQIPNTPADTLIPANSNGQVLGIFTANGNVNLNVPTAGQNLEIDASIATISKTGSGGIVNTGAAINTLNIVGGRIQNTIQNINATTRNVFFDRRFSQGSFAPPWFPSTTIAGTPSDSVTSVVPSAQRTQWVTPMS